jgi:hypothetical protein
MDKTLKYLLLLNTLCLSVMFGMIFLKIQRDAAKADMMNKMLDLGKEILERRRPH